MRLCVMLNHMRPAVWFSIVSTITACGFCQRAESGCGDLFPLSRHLTETSFAARTVLEALFELGSTHGICIGIQVSSPSVLNPPEKIDTRNALLKTVLANLLENAPEYQFTESANVVLVKPRTGFSKWLTRRVPYFKTERGPLLFVNSFYLRASYDALDRTAGEGSVGSLSPGDTSDLVGPFEERGKPLESLLTILIGQSDC